MIKIPSATKVRWWQHSYVVELASLIGSVSATGVGIYQTQSALSAANSSSSNSGSGITSGIVLLVAGLLWTVAFGIIKVLQARLRDVKTLKDESPMDLLGCTHVLHSLLKMNFPSNELQHGDLRITIHKILFDKTGNPESYERIVPYVGGDPGTPSLKLPIQTGIVGLAARTNEINFFVRTKSDYDEYVTELKKRFGFTDAQARAVKSDRYSFFSVPICDDKNKVVGVVYLDSRRANAFEKQEIQAIVVAASTGIARFLEERYK